MSNQQQPSNVGHLAPRLASKAIGECAFCGHEIVAPADVLVWADDASYHQACYQTHLARKMTDEGIRPAI